MTSNSSRDAPPGDLQALAEAAPDLPSTWIKLASDLEESGAVSEAVEAWKTAWLLVPNSPRITDAIDRLGIDTGVAAAAASSVSSPKGAIASQEGPNPHSDPHPDSSELDIDTLITDLQSGRSEPTIEFDESDRSRTQDSRAEGLVSETLAKIYESQNHLAEAAQIYEILADQAPDTKRADVLRARAADLRNRTSKRG